MRTLVKPANPFADHCRAAWRVAALVLLVFSLSATGGWPVELPFGAQQVISTAHSDAECAVAADLDGDGDLDVLAASSGDGKIAWYENTDGLGTFGAQQVILTAEFSSFSVFVADIDGDGDLDPLSTSWTHDRVAWYRNDGSASPLFTQQVITEDPDGTAGPLQGDADGASFVYAADLDGDGDIDVLSASHNDDKIAWYENTDGLGTFGSQQVISTAADYASSVHAADLDGDGDLDVLSASGNDDKIAWYENRLTDGVNNDFNPTQKVITILADVAVSVFAGDLDGDGDADVLSASGGDSKIAWYENTDGLGTFGLQQVISNSALSAIFVCADDLDKDGDLDALSASGGDDKIAWYENDGAPAPSFTERIVTVDPDGGGSLEGEADSPTSVFVADLDGDGDPDVMSTSFDDDKIAWHQNLAVHRSASFPAQTAVSLASSGAQFVSTADVDRDGDLDVISASFTGTGVAWHESDGADPPGFTDHPVSTDANTPEAIDAADLDGDGDIDLLSASYNDNKIAWYENDGSQSFTQHTISTSADGALDVIAADADGDGDMDVLSASSVDDEISWYENDGLPSPGFTAYTISAGALTAQEVFAIDLDRDGDTDVLSASFLDDKIAWYENDGSENFTPHTITTAADGASSVFAIDVDGDGDVDVLSAAAADNEVAWYENDGAQNFSEHVISSAAMSVNSIYAADLDDDGDIDVVSASVADDKIAWYENDGLQNFTARTISTNADAALSVSVGDLDGDGDLDVLSASQLDNKIAWYDNRGGQFALPTTDTSQGVILDGQLEDVLRIGVVHRGRAGDSDAEWVTLEILLEETVGDPLTDTEANDLIQSVSVHLDDGSATFDPGSDILVTTVSGLSLVAGVATIAFADDDANVQVSFGAPKTYFVAVLMTSDASAQTPNSFQVTHLIEASSTGEDAAHDLPLTLEFGADTTTGVIDTVLSSATCTAPYDLNLSNITVSTPLVCQAGTVIRAGTSFVVAAPAGDLTFRAGQSIELRDGFDVEANAAFTAEIDPGLQP